MDNFNLDNFLSSIKSMARSRSETLTAIKQDTLKNRMEVSLKDRLVNDGDAAKGVSEYSRNGMVPADGHEDAAIKEITEKKVDQILRELHLK